ncbi:replication factor-A carboxy-terminal domain protein [Spatholobus suberectus]|nr:replication factor-A carboxy-terminal domain protein [Spatholobus suberectus]
MDHMISSIDDIMSAKIDWKLNVHVIQSWTVPNFNQQNQVNSIEMLFLDEKGGRIHASIKRNNLDQFREFVQEGLIYIIENLLPFDHSLKGKDDDYLIDIIGHVVQKGDLKRKMLMARNVYGHKV